MCVFFTIVYKYAYMYSEYNIKHTYGLDTGLFNILNKFIKYNINSLFHGKKKKCAINIRLVI
jgi:hypothetical protein